MSASLLLNGKVALVTGGARGIGLATARAMAAEGAQVVIADVNEEAGRNALEEIEQAGGQARFEPLDVSEAAAVDRVIGATRAAFGGLDVLVNNAGIVRDARLVKMTPEQWSQVISVNLTGVFLCGQAAARVLVEQNRGGVIVNISSVVGLYGNFGQSNYAAAKAGVIGLTRTWARELGQYNIRVNAIAPGFIATEIIQAMPERVIGTMKARTPLGRLGEASDIAEACVWLASARAGFITGAVLSVDGGLVL